MSRKQKYRTIGLMKRTESVPERIPAALLLRQAGLDVNDEGAVKFVTGPESFTLKAMEAVGVEVLGQSEATDEGRVVYVVKGLDVKAEPGVMEALGSKDDDGSPGQPDLFDEDRVVKGEDEDDDEEDLDADLDDEGDVIEGEDEQDDED